MKRIYVLLGLCGLYGLNRFLLIPGLSSAVQNLQGSGAAAVQFLLRFFSGHGADVLAGAWILCFFNLILVWSGRRPIRRMGWAVLFVLGCGIFWEYITPLYLSRTVSDPLDVAAYLVGGCVYLLFERGELRGRGIDVETEFEVPSK